MLVWEHEMMFCLSQPRIVPPSLIGIEILDRRGIGMPFVKRSNRIGTTVNHSRFLRDAHTGASLLRGSRDQVFDGAVHVVVDLVVAQLNDHAVALHEGEDVGLDARQSEFDTS